MGLSFRAAPLDIALGSHRRMLIVERPVRMRRFDEAYM